MNGQLPQTPPDEERRAALQELAEKYHITDVNAELPGDTDSPLMAAAEHADQLDLMKLLITAGADVNKRNSDMDTPLLVACYAENIEAVKLLVEHGADVNAAELYGVTSLMEAVTENQVEVIEILLKAGANPNIMDIYNSTALDYADNCQAGPCVQLLRAYGGRTGHELQLLKHAVLQNDEDVVRRLLSETCKLDRFEVESAALELSQHWNLQILELLLPSLTSVASGTVRLYLMNQAALCGRSEFLHVLLESGIDPNGRHVAADGGDTPSVYLPDFLYPLRAAIQGGNGHQSYACVRLLLEYGARPDLPDENGITPLEWAEREGNEECAELLRAAMK